MTFITPRTTLEILTRLSINHIQLSVPLYLGRAVCRSIPQTHAALADSPFANSLRCGQQQVSSSSSYFRLPDSIDRSFQGTHLLPRKDMVLKWLFRGLWGGYREKTPNHNTELSKITSREQHRERMALARKAFKQQSGTGDFVKGVDKLIPRGVHRFTGGRVWIRFPDGTESPIDALRLLRRSICLSKAEQKLFRDIAIKYPPLREKLIAEKRKWPCYKDYWNIIDLVDELSQMLTGTTLKYTGPPVGDQKPTVHEKKPYADRHPNSYTEESKLPVIEKLTHLSELALAQKEDEGPSLLSNELIDATPVQPERHATPRFENNPFRSQKENERQWPLSNELINTTTTQSEQGGTPTSEDNPFKDPEISPIPELSDDSPVCGSPGKSRKLPKFILSDAGVITTANMETPKYIISEAGVITEASTEAEHSR